MAKETGKPKPTKAAGVRRTSVRRQRPGMTAALRHVARSPAFGWGVLISIGFVLVCGTITSWTREQPLIAVDRVMNQTMVARVETQVPDPAATEQERRIASSRSPRIWEANEQEIEKLVTSLRELPKTVSVAETLGEVNDEIRTRFGLTEERLVALKAQAVEGEPSPEWSRLVASLREQLLRRPVVASDAWQTVSQENWERSIELWYAGKEMSYRPGAADVINIAEKEPLRKAMRQAGVLAGFSGPLLDVVTARLTAKDRAPTYLENTGRTQELEAAAVAAIPEKMRRIPAGEVIYRRSEPLTQQKLDDARYEMRAYAQARPGVMWLKRLGMFGAVAIVAAAVAGYLALFCPRVRRNPERMAGVAVLLAGGVAVACWGTASIPVMASLFMIAPAIFVAVILAVAYDRRIGTAIGVLLSILICLGLRRSMGDFAVMVGGVAIAAWNLAEIRDRRSLVRMTLWTTSGLALLSPVLNLAERPLVQASLVEMLVDAFLAGSAGLLVGMITMFVLSHVERAFDITTGMSLIELRDPKHPLLKQLQQKAPGTYNHSLNVATIAESAADAIGADALLTYVGGLYHDVGKMNKPEYFVENQAGGPSKHDKLSPAMSLLVIVGHVKDGAEMAREFNLPRSIQHFIEAHHGTTLVEYFYHRAKTKAQEEEATAREGQPEVEKPREFTYRYPGPKPQTKEVAILMLADAVEGATRTLADPTPSRIDTLVRDLANKRLMDGQFDECDLTLRDLKTIVDSIAKTVASIYHGRIAYPAGEKRA